MFTGTPLKTVFLSHNKSGVGLINSIIKCSGESLHDASIIYLQNQNSTTGKLHWFNISHDLSAQMGIKLLDSLQNYAHYFDQFVWVIRNPITSGYSHKNTFDLSLTDAFAQWYVTNVCIWYFLSTISETKKKIIRFEDVLLHKTVITELFRFIDIPFNQQYWKYEDFHNAAPIDYERIDNHLRYNDYELNEIWKTYSMTPIVQEFKYHSSRVE